MGMMLNGELYRGGRDGAGEFGHSTVIENGPLCNCGKLGCVEAYVGEYAILRAAANAIGAPITLQEAIDRARSNDERIVAVFRLPATRSGLRFHPSSTYSIQPWSSSAARGRNSSISCCLPCATRS